MEWSTVTPFDTALGEFSLSGDYTAVPTPLTAPNINIGDATTECAADYVVIPQGTLVSSTTGAVKDR